MKIRDLMSLQDLENLINALKQDELFKQVIAAN